MEHGLLNHHIVKTWTSAGEARLSAVIRPDVSILMVVTVANVCQISLEMEKFVHVRTKRILMYKDQLSEKNKT